MANPRKPTPGTSQKAPQANRPTAPFERSHKKPLPATSLSGRDERKDKKSAKPQLSRRSPAATSAQAAPAQLKTGSTQTGAILSRRASERLRAGHLWVYASDIESVETKGTGAPALMPVADNRGLLLGTALYSPVSQIALRLISREAIDEVRWLEILAERLRVAIAKRTELLDKGTNACRLVFSEADDLPGLICDKYAEIVIVQLLTKGLDTDATRRVCAQVLSEELSNGPLTVWERPDARIRELEGLSAPATTPLFHRGSKTPASKTLFRLNGLSFLFDVNSGQKTGAFLDQRQNYAAAAAWAKAHHVKKALDVCTYQGGFALHLAQVCEKVTGIDASQASLEVAERNLTENRAKLAAQVDWVEADAFEVLRAWSTPAGNGQQSAGESSWDLIVLDPPAFAKSQRAVEGALRGYKELNLRALRMLKPGGLLITCSCSHHVTWSDLEGAVASAAVDAQRRVTLLERRGAALDHPVVLNLPETEYLKCLICQLA